MGHVAIFFSEAAASANPSAKYTWCFAQCTGWLNESSVEEIMALYSGPTSALLTNSSALVSRSVRAQNTRRWLHVVICGWLKQTGARFRFMAASVITRILNGCRPKELGAFVAAVKRGEISGLSAGVGGGTNRLTARRHFKFSKKDICLLCMYMPLFKLNRT